MSDEIDDWMREQNDLDDILCAAIDSIKVGDKVQYEDVDGVGVIIHIGLNDAAFRVKWEDGSPTDWYFGSQLRKVSE